MVRIPEPVRSGPLDRLLDEEELPLGLREACQDEIKKLVGRPLNDVLMLLLLHKCERVVCTFFECQGRKGHHDHPVQVLVTADDRCCVWVEFYTPGYWA